MHVKKICQGENVLKYSFLNWTLMARESSQEIVCTEQLALFSPIKKGVGHMHPTTLTLYWVKRHCQMRTP